MAEHPILTLKNLTKNFTPGVPSGVRDVSFSIARGQIISIVGESGSGKSTLLKLIYGLLSPDSGAVYFEDKLVRGPDEKLIPGHEKMKMVTQDFNLNTFAKVYENIAAMLPNTNLKAKRDQTTAMMEFLRIDHLANKRAADLSGGEQQRVAIARAIITEPDVLLMDEPFSQVDALLKNDLRADIERLARDLGITVILVSHDPVDGLSLANNMVILRQGQLQEQGAPKDLYQNPSRLYTAQLLANCNVLTAAEAYAIGLSTAKASVVVYPEWIVALDKEQEGNLFTVRGSIFKGFFEEVIVEKNGVHLRALNMNVGTYRVGEEVSVKIDRVIGY